MDLSTLNGQLAIVGGVSGLAILVYLSLMVYFARQKDKHIQELQIQLARIEGLLLGGKRR